MRITAVQWDKQTAQPTLFDSGPLSITVDGRARYIGRWQAATIGEVVALAWLNYKAALLRARLVRKLAVRHQ